MTYVFDTNSFAVLKNFYPAIFPSFWDALADMVELGKLVSVEEVYNECARRIDSEHLSEWIETHKGLFLPPSEDEMAFVAKIFAVPHFQQLVGNDVLLRGGFVADPWVIARAAVLGGCVVTEEKLKPNAAKIPNVCEHFGVRWTNVEGFLRDNGWQY